jgi:hypothetical protein
MRPILERIDHTVRHVATATSEEPLAVPRIGYSLLDLIDDFRNNPGGVAEVEASLA